MRGKGKDSMNPSSDENAGRARSNSAPVDPDIAVVDSHHHLWLKPNQKYFVEEFEADLASCGHEIVGSVYVECHSMYRRSGADAWKPVGEAQFYAAEMARSTYVARDLGCGFVGTADLTLGDAVDEIFDAFQLESGGKFKGIRCAVYWDEDASLNLGLRPYAPKGLLLDPGFRRGFARLSQRGLVYDAWQYEPQLPELCSLADQFEDAMIVVNHCGGPLGINAYATPDRFSRWRAAVREVARRQNTVMKLSGLTAPRIGLGLSGLAQRPDAETLARIWQPYIEVCVEAFGPSRCLFGSNFPVDLAVCEYGDLIDAYKLATRQYGTDERRAIFADTANRIYGLGIDGKNRRPVSARRGCSGANRLN